MENVGKLDFFKPLDGIDSVEEATEVESYCVNCEENGVTKLLLTKIPFYKEVIISSFSCPHCFYSNNEIQSAGELQREGIEYNLEVKNLEDLSRQVVKSDYAAISIRQLDLEIPSKSQKGETTTVEGILARIITGLEQDQPVRKLEHPEDYAKIEEFLTKIRACQQAETPFSMRLRDISGNSFVSCRPSCLPSQKDDELHVSKISRTTEEDHQIGYFPEMQTTIDENEEDAYNSGELDLQGEVLEFSTNCPECSAPCTTKMKVTKIPYFKEVVIMATDCDHCGNRSNEVKSGAGIEPKGIRISLKITNVDDLSRDVLKSETCSIEIPELELEVGSGLLGGKFTTIEGLLNNIKDQLSQENPLFSGDSADPKMKDKMILFCEKFEKLISCEDQFTIILDDPAGNCYLQNVYAPDEDPNMKVEKYERTFDQNEELGLNDMNTENDNPEVVDC